MITYAYLLMLLIADPNILPNEIAMLDAPGAVLSIIEEWDYYQRLERGTYFTVIVENWLRSTRKRTYAREFNGIRYTLWTAPYSWVGDLNHDEKINLKDFAIYAKYYTGSISIKILADFVNANFMKELIK